MYKIAISILHYNSNKDTIACLASLMKANFGDFNVTTYVLDNASKEKLPIKDVDYKKINLKQLSSPINLGFTGGHNLIFDKAGKDFDFFLLLNNDSIVDKDFLIEMVKAMEDKKIGACVPKIYFTRGCEFHSARYKEDEKGRVFWYAGGYIDWDNVMSVHRGVDEVDHGQYDKLDEVSFATAACLLIRGDLLDEIGLFDDKYFLYYEDADLNVRIAKRGYRIVYVPEGIVWHNNSGSSGSGSELHDYYLTRNRMIFGMRYAPIRVKIALLRESLRLIQSGRKWQRIGIRDYYLKKFGKGSYRP